MGSNILCADTHCHLDDPAFAADIADVITRARATGIHPLVAPSESLSSCEHILNIALRHPAVLPCIGVHPHKAESFDPSQKGCFAEMAAMPEVVGIGEIGLDYFYEHSKREQQIETLTFFLDLAVRHNKPACIHVRDKSGQTDASEDLMSLIRPRIGKLRGVVHCFTGTYEEARAFLDAGLHLSFTGILTFKTAESLRDVFARLPSDRILLETDAPYLAPVPNRGARNEPAFLKSTFALAATLRNLPESDWSAELHQTQVRFFGERCGVA